MKQDNKTPRLRPVHRARSFLVLCSAICLLPVAAAAQSAGLVIGADALERCAWSDYDKQIYVQAARRATRDHESAEIKVEAKQELDRRRGEEGARIANASPDVLLQLKLERVAYATHGIPAKICDGLGDATTIAYVEVRRNAADVERDRRRLREAHEQNRQQQDVAETDGDVFSGRSGDAGPGEVFSGGDICAKSPDSYQCLFGRPKIAKVAPPVPAPGPSHARATLPDPATPPENLQFCGPFDGVVEGLEDMTQWIWENTDPRAREDFVAVDGKVPPIPPGEAPNAPGVMTGRGCDLGCFQSALAQDLRWKSGLAYVALPYPTAGSTTLVTSGGRKWEVLGKYYGAQVPDWAWTFGKIETMKLIRTGHPVKSTRAAIECGLSMLGARGGQPRGMVFVAYDDPNDRFGHVFNARWLADGTWRWEESPFASGRYKVYGGKVEFWDASLGKPASWGRVKNVWYYPTN
jgi:hypothetical protein